MSCVNEQVVELNVGGHCFTTLRSTLSKYEDCMLCKMFSGDLAPSHQDSHGRYFIDRDGTHFGSVLAYLRGEPLQLPSSFAERSALAAEGAFYQVCTHCNSCHKVGQTQALLRSIVITHLYLVPCAGSADISLLLLHNTTVNKLSTNCIEVPTWVLTKVDARSHLWPYALRAVVSV